ncbi:hypothetical protein N7488_000506 [Penicillium malachiteum]|nr:hypothetical protein N7488_000506 [Penicillium malachiteum]
MLNPNCETMHRLEARMVFNGLASDKTEDENRSKAYAHHPARACWHGARIVLRQTSPEAESIFDFIIELHRACEGQWNQFHEAGIEQRDLDHWLEFAGTFLSSLGNYFVGFNFITSFCYLSQFPDAEIEAITKLMETKKIAQENTRLRKVERGAFEILQASAEKDAPRYLGQINIDDQRIAKISLARGDHSSKMTKIYAELSEARKFANTEE